MKKVLVSEIALNVISETQSLSAIRLVVAILFQLDRLGRYDDVDMAEVSAEVCKSVVSA